MALTFFIIKKTVGLRVSEEEEIMGLDISEHGSYGYPEQMSTETVVTTSIKEKEVRV